MSYLVGRSSKEDSADEKKKIYWRHWRVQRKEMQKTIGSLRWTKIKYMLKQVGRKYHEEEVRT